MKTLNLSALFLMAAFMLLSFGFPADTVARQNSFPVKELILEKQQGDPEFSQRSHPRIKNKSTAIVLGATITALPALIGYAAGGQTGLTIAGHSIIFGPTAGLLYAKDLNRGAMGFGVRMGGVVIIYTGALIYSFSNLFGNDQFNAGSMLMVGGAGTIAVSAFYDIFFAAPRAVENYNRTGHNRKPAVSPWIDPVSGGAGFSLRFSLKP